jgi:hypothetical protein
MRKLQGYQKMKPRMEEGQYGGGKNTSNITQPSTTLWLCHIWTKTIGPYTSLKKNKPFTVILYQGSTTT